MIYLGLDQSLSSAGVVVLNDEGRVLFQGLIEPGKRRGAERLAYEFDEFSKIIEEWKPDFAAMEGYSYGSTGRLFELGECGGTLKLCMYKHQLPFIIVPPTTLKKFVTGNGGSNKDAMARWTKTKWQIEINQEDVCDAYGLARVAREYKQTTTCNRTELEVIKSLRAPPQPKLTAKAKRALDV